MGLIILQGLLPLAIVLVTKALVDAVVGGHAAAVPLLTLGFLLFIEQVLGSLATWIRILLGEKVQDHVMGLIHAQVQRLDLAFLETPDYYDQLYRASVDARSRPMALLESTGALFQHGITLVALSILLFRYAPWLPLLLMGSMVPALASVARTTLTQYLWRKSRVLDERRCRYLDWLLTDREPAMELRLFRLGTWTGHAFQSLRAKLRGEQVALATQAFRLELSAGVAAVGGMLGGLAWMIRRLRGGASLGDLALFAQVFTQGQRLLQTLSTQAGEIYRNLLFLENLFGFLDLEPRLLDPRWPERPSVDSAVKVAFENVHFRYPHQQGWALDGFNLQVAPGEVVAIVGDNGAGKSTLIKLLARFYDPQEGIVAVQGLDAKAWRQEDLRRQLTVLFQDPVQYHATAAENIAQSDLSALESPERIRHAAALAGADGPIAKLPQGYDTVLGSWFGGVQLSGGEWQRLALARAFLNPAPILVLDEPTSAMDSWAEAEWLDRFRTLAEGRTVLIITHRFTTALRADRIVVMEAGRVVEEGTHAELLQQGGKYADSWRRQMEAER